MQEVGGLINIDTGTNSSLEQTTTITMGIGDGSVDTTLTVSNNFRRNVQRRPKSGRCWKSFRKERSTGIIKVKPLKSSWKHKMKEKAELENVRKLQHEIRNKLAAKKAAKIEAQKERERRREENARKAEIVQMIKNTQKLKKVKKKHLRKIEKRDIENY